MAIRAATISTKDGTDIVIVAVLAAVLADERRRLGVLDALRGFFPNQQVVLAASTSNGMEFVADTPEIAATVRKRGISRLERGDRTPLCQPNFFLWLV